MTLTKDSAENTLTHTTIFILLIPKKQTLKIHD